MIKKEMIAMLLAGGQGSRLGVLTSKLAKPAVAFGGKYKIIDFPLSNCINSGIDTVGVLTQYQPLRLNQHIGIGIPWDLDRNIGGVSILPPYEKSQNTDWYTGTANAIYQNMEFMEYYHPDYVIILGGDHIYKMDYELMLEFHKKNNAQITLATYEVPWEDASRFGLVITDENNQILEFEEKPANPRSNKASMGIYIFNWKLLRKLLLADMKNPESSHDFGKDIIPTLLNDGKRLFAYRFKGYWKDVGTIDSLWEANMEVLDPEHSGINLFDENWKIYSRNSGMTGHRIGEDAIVEESMVTDGCNIQGTVKHSVLFSGVTVEKGAVVEDAVVMGRTTIKSGAVVKHCILAENVMVEENAVVGQKPADGSVGEVATVASNVTIGKNAKIGPNAMLYEDVKEGEQHD